MTNLIIDTDIGDDIDDAFALCLAMQSPEINLLGVTTVFRCAGARARIAKKLLTLGGFGNVPVHAGSNRPLQITELFGKPIDYGRLPKEYGPEFDSVEYDGDDAVAFMANLLAAAAEPVTIVTLGALTNVARLLTEYPNLKDRIAEIDIMGGSYFHMNKCEYNFACDPHAADTVLCAGLKVYCVGVDITFRCRLGEQALDRLKACTHPCIQLLMRLNGRWGNRMFLHDPLALTAAFDKSYLKFRSICCRVEAEARYANGFVADMSGVDWLPPHDGVSVNACYDVDAERFVQSVVSRLLSFDSEKTVISL